MQTWNEVIKQIEIVTGQSLSFVTAEAMHGGDINRAYHLRCEQRSYFIKFNQADLLPMFEVEVLGLNELADTNTLRIPEAIICGIAGEDAFLVMEFVPLQAMSMTTQQLLGQQLAHLHQQPQDFFGWHHDNYIGSNVQKNTRNNNWASFWQEQRLQEQLKLAADNGYTGKVQQLGEQLMHLIPDFFSSYQPQASLLHGDLWSGNAAADTLGNAVIYDPACYYGDREADIAMTELFGGYGSAFYAAYNEVWALDSGYSRRKKLYNLYHILNHLNLFGNGYLHQSEDTMRQLIAEIK